MRYALVTGATSGLGKEIAIKLSESGWNVFACGKTRMHLKKSKLPPTVIP